MKKDSGTFAAGGTVALSTAMTHLLQREADLSHNISTVWLGQNVGTELCCNQNLTETKTIQAWVSPGGQVEAGWRPGGGRVEAGWRKGGGVITHAQVTHMFTNESPRLGLEYLTCLIIQQLHVFGSRSEVCEDVRERCFPNRGWWMLGKLWCHVAAGGKPPDVFGLQFKQTKLWQSRNNRTSICMQCVTGLLRPALWNNPTQLHCCDLMQQLGNLKGFAG